MYKFYFYLLYRINPQRARVVEIILGVFHLRLCDVTSDVNKLKDRLIEFKLTLLQMFENDQTWTIGFTNSTA